MSLGTLPPKVTLQTSLHTATRDVHANLNKTITARLPLCLPAYSSDPTAYYLGMLMFGRLFLTFEDAITHVLLESSSTDESKTRNTRLLQILSTEGLPRSEALNRDFQTLSKRLCERNPAVAQLEARVHNQAIESTKYIFTNIKSRPYLALAYTWTLYLALFNGGRWLYKQLDAPGPEFWLEPWETGEEEDEVIQSLSFWRFDVSHQDPNAEELKLEFKRNFEQASEMLSAEEKEEVVMEAVDLFDLCLKMIDDLDAIMVEVNGDTQQRTSSPVVLNKIQVNTESATSVWNILSLVLFQPAYRILNSKWAQPLKEEVKAVD